MALPTWTWSVGIWTGSTSTRTPREGAWARAAEACARAAGVQRLETHASITARPFFAARGYRLLREQAVERGGIRLKNYVMILEL